VPVTEEKERRMKACKRNRDKSIVETSRRERDKRWGHSSVVAKERMGLEKNFECLVWHGTESEK